MVRRNVRLSGRLALSAAISWTLIPIASADAPPSQDAAAEPPAITSQTASETPAKILHTVPEDGIGDTKWLSGATRFVRETLAKRPKEDLVICIGGCVPKQDRIVYAQPSEYVPPKPDDLMSDAKPSAPAKAVPPTAQVDKPAEKPAAKPDTKSAAATPAAQPVAEPAAKPVTAPNAKPIDPAQPMASEALRPALAPAAAAARPEDMKKLEFVPSASQPQPAAAERDEDTTVPLEDRPKARQKMNQGAMPAIAK